jgi:signal transduction histidine kinase
MKTSHASPSSSPRGGSPPGGVVSSRDTPGQTPLPRWLTAGAWGLTLALGLFLFSPDGEISLSGFVARTLYLGLVGGMCGLLVSQEHRRAHQRQGERTSVDRLLAVNQTLSTLDLEVLLRQVVKEVTQLIPCRGASIMVLNQQQQRVEKIAVAGQFPTSAATDLSLTLSKGLLHDALAHGVVALNTPQALHAQLPSLQVREAIQHNVLVVRLQRKHAMGFLLLADKAGVDGFQDREVRLLTVIAEHIAAAIENARLFSELRAVGVERRTLLHALIRAQEHERLRVADEWHDRLSTKLFDLLQGFRSCQQLVAQRVPEGKERFERLAAEIDAMAAFVRRFANEIYPSVLDDFGFVAALREYIAEMEEQEPFDVTVQAEAIDHPLPTEANLTLFRITQEALQNVRKHARARHVQIALVQEHSGVSLMIKDDGQGFNPEQSLPGHYGLLYMREHAEAYGGTFRVVSSQGQGTEVRVDFPTQENSRRGRTGKRELG